jgi:hypothetical protein
MENPRAQNSGFLVKLSKKNLPEILRSIEYKIEKQNKSFKFRKLYAGLLEELLTKGTVTKPSNDPK